MRLFWILILLVGAVVFVPSLRERVLPHVEFALNPIYEWQTKNRVNAITRELVRARAEGTKFPRPRDFQAFLAEREGDEAAVDPWGEPYFLYREGKTYRVSSAGADRYANTEDDIQSTLAVPVETAREANQRRRDRGRRS